MTPAKRLKHITELKQLLIAMGFQKDRYGNYLYPGRDDFRVKFKKVNVAFQWKVGGRWGGSGYSKVISQLTLDAFREALENKLKLFKDQQIATEAHEKGKGEKENKKKEKVLIPLAPGLETPEGQKKVEEALQKRDHCDYRCYMLLKDALEKGLIDYDPTPDAPDEVNEFVDECKEVIRDRINANDEFLKAAAGR